MKEEDFFDSAFGFTSNTVMFLTEYRITFSIKSSWPVLHNMSLSVRMDKKFTQSFVSFLYYHPNLDVSQFSVQRNKTLFPGSHCNALSCLSLIYSSNVGRGVLQKHQKWSNTKTQQLKNSPTVTLHLKLADKVETTSVPLAILPET